MTITPTITTSITPGLAITTVPKLSYAAILNSLGVWVYDVDTLFYQASTANQFSNPIQYSVYNANGNVQGQQIITPIGPLQYQSSMYVPLKGKGVALDSDSGFNFNMQPSSSIRFIFYARCLSNNDFIDEAGGTDNFKETEKDMQLPQGFFDIKQEDQQ